MAKTKKKEVAPEKERSRNWRLVLYPDCEAHCLAVEKIQSGDYEYALILHDKDVKDDQPDDFDDLEEETSLGAIKKAHWHVVLKVKNPRYREAFAAELGVEMNYLRPADNINGAILYLIHRTPASAHRYQYDPDEVEGTLKDFLLTLLDKQQKTEAERVLEIVEYIDSIDAKVSFRKTLVWACKNGLYSDFRRLGIGITYLIQEHNDEYYAFQKACEEGRAYAMNQDNFVSYLQRSDSVDWVARCQIAEAHQLHPKVME